MITKRNKYGNKKVVVNGVKFDSKLELYLYELMVRENIPFTFQEKVVLMEKFRFNDKAVREMAMIVDFVIRVDNHTIYVDTKGFATDVAKIKYKLLRNKLKDYSNTSVVWLKNKKEVVSFIEKYKKLWEA